MVGGKWEDQYGISDTEPLVPVVSELPDTEDIVVLCQHLTLDALRQLHLLIPAETNITKLVAALTAISDRGYGRVSGGDGATSPTQTTIINILANINGQTSGIPSTHIKTIEGE